MKVELRDNARGLMKMELRKLKEALQSCAESLDTIPFSEITDEQLSELAYDAMGYVARIASHSRSIGKAYANLQILIAHEQQNLEAGGGNSND